jgi:phosphatidylglycerol:prolipoprotein diacylglycerol transferase
MALGIVVGLGITLHLAKKDNFPTEIVYTSLLWLLIGGMLGARAVHVLDELNYYVNSPKNIPLIWEGGLSWYGGLIGGILATAIYSRVKHFPLGHFADLVAPGVILGLAVGRIGCTINGDACGTPTSLPWGLLYTQSPYCPSDVATHPAPVYEILWNLIIFAVLWWLRGRLKQEGSLFMSMIALYSFGRFFISCVRVEPEILGPLHQAHIISLVLFVAAVILLIYRRVSWTQNKT